MLERRGPDGRGGHHLAVQHNGQTAVGRTLHPGTRRVTGEAPGGDVVEPVYADRSLVEVEPDLPLVIDEQRVGVGNGFASQNRGTQEVPLAAGVVPQPQHDEILDVVVLRIGVAVGADSRYHSTGSDLRASGMDPRPRARGRCLGSRRVTDPTYRAEPEFGSGPHKGQSPVLVVDPGERHHHSGLGSRNLRFSDPQAVDPVPDDRHRLVEHLLGGRLCGRKTDGDATLQVQTQQGFVAPNHGHDRGQDAHRKDAR